MKYKLTIAWLYPDLMSTYGDRGNIIALQKRAQWRDIEVEVKKLSLGSTKEELSSCDLIFMGGGEDRQQKIVAEDFNQGKSITLSSMIEQEIPGLYICGAYQFLGKYYKEADGTMIEGLGILDLYTENPGLDKPRLIGNIAIELQTENPTLTGKIVGFENHGGRTYLGKNIKPLGKVLKGHGNNGQDHTEGAIYKNSIGTYFHGPILPKNPGLADFLLTKALSKKYQEKIILPNLNDDLEKKARDVIVRKLDLAV